MQFDITIVGGGMVGAALASALRDTPFKIALIDAIPQNASEDHRLIALNHNSYTLFKNLGIWQALAPHASEIKSVHVSHRGHFGSTKFSAAEFNLNVLGYVIPAKYINAALYEKISALQNVTLIRPAKVTELHPENDYVDLTLTLDAEKKSLRSKIVIGADGSFSTLRELLGISAEIKDYHQLALVTVTTLQRHHQHIAYERFQNSGAIAMLPLHDNCAATIWTDDENSINTLLHLSDEDFIAQLQQQFGYRLGRFLKIQKRYTYPLKFIKAKEQIKNRTILIGNAAHTVHPIAAQGLNLALYEIAVLAEYFQSQNTLTLPNALDYSKMQQQSMQLSHQLTHVFSTDIFIVNAARQIGLLGLDIIHPLKQKFMQFAMNKSGHLPKLLLEKDFYESGIRC